MGGMRGRIETCQKFFRVVAGLSGRVLGGVY